MMKAAPVHKDQTSRVAFGAVGVLLLAAAARSSNRERLTSVAWNGPCTARRPNRISTSPGLVLCVAALCT